MLSEFDPAAYVAGIIDGEGTINRHRNSRNIEICNTDLGIIEAVRACLKELGIGYREREFQPKNEKCKYMYVIYISQRGNLEKARDLLPLQSIKAEQLEELLGSYVREKAHRWPTLIKD